jgi:hypothetical protein
MAALSQGNDIVWPTRYARDRSGEFLDGKLKLKIVVSSKNRR